MHEENDEALIEQPFDPFGPLAREYWDLNAAVRAGWTI